MKQFNLTYSTIQWFALASLLSAVLVIAFGLQRTDSVALMFCFTLAFAAYWYLMAKSKLGHSYFIVGILPRIALLFSLPNLSDDYFRFLWDGELLNHSYGPYSYLPSELVEHLKALNPSNSMYVQSLYDGMNSPGYYSVYPPINQWLFWVSAQFSNIYLGVVFLKLCILLADIGVFFVLKKLLQRFSLSTQKVGLYWLNPLVIIELSGNVHFEGVLLFFFLLAALNFARLKDKEGAFYFAFSVLSKLFSLLFLPLLLLKFMPQRAIRVTVIVALVVLFCFMPLLDWVDVQHLFSSYDLYFQHFEFNGGLYRLARFIGYSFSGYNQIAFVGPLLAILSTTIILLISYLYRFRNRLSLFTGFLLINGVYLFFSPIVHPWYLVMMIGFSVLSKHRFAWVWSGTIFLSYLFYQGEGVQENPWVIALEYVPVFIVLYLDLKKHLTWTKIKAGFLLT